MGRKDMMLRFILGMVMAALFALTGCRPTQTERRLREADAVMESDPDSALSILDGIDRLSLQGEDLAYYALLKTQGDVKTNVIVDSDSLISIALGHYADSKDEEKRKRAYFYSAQVAFYRRDYPAAMRAVLPAYEYAKEKNDHYWIAKSAELMADVFAETYNYPQEEKYRKEAADNYQKAGKIRNHRFALCDLAIARINDNNKIGGLSLLDSIYHAELKSSKLDTILMESILEAAGIEFLGEFNGFDDLREVSEAFMDFDSVDSSSTLQTSLLKARQNRHDSLKDFDKWMLHARSHCQDSTEYIQILYVEYLHAKETNDFKSMALTGDTIMSIQNSIVRSILSESMLAAQGQFYQQDSYAKTEALRYSRLRNAFCLLLIMFVTFIALASYVISRKKHKRELEYKINLIYLLEKENRTKSEDNNHLRNALQYKEDSINKATAQYDTLVSTNKTQKEDMSLILWDQWKILNTLCKEYYETLYDSDMKRSLTKKIETEIMAYTSEENLRQIEHVVDLSSDGIVTEFRKQFPNLNEKDYAMLSLACAGFSAKAVCLFLNLKYKNFFLRRTRLIERIKASDASGKDKFVQFLSKSNN